MKSVRPLIWDDTYAEIFKIWKKLKSFTTANTFNETDQVLQNVKYWPNIATVGYFKTKLKFQIQHSLFR